MPDPVFSFNLIDEPWLPCVWKDGRRGELGLRAVLQQSSEIAEVAGENPLVTPALYRLLLTIVHRCSGDPAGPATPDAWQSLRKRGRFDPAPIDSYLDRFHSRFDLFGAERPFYQVAGLPRERAASVARLRQQGDSSPTLFDHQMVDPPPSLSPAEAARALVAAQSFDLGGIKTSDNAQGKEFSDGAPLIQSAVCLVRGDNLFETLLLNLVGYEPDGMHQPYSFDSTADRTAWEREEVTGSRDRVPDGYLDLLTWQARRILLLPELDAVGNVVVRSAVLFKGYQFPGEFSQNHAETMVPYRALLKAAPGQKPFTPLRLSEDRALWRDSTALLASVEDNSYSQPGTLAWLRAVSGAGIDVPNPLPIDVFGFSADKSKPLFWRHERLAIPRDYLDDPSLVQALRQALNTAETAARLLGWRLIDVERPGKAKVPYSSPLMVLAMNMTADKDAQKKLAAHISPELGYWQRLESPFQTLLSNLPGDRTLNAFDEVTHGLWTLPVWRSSVREAVQQAFRNAVNGFESSGKAHRAVALAERQLGILLAHVVPREPAAEGDAVPETAVEQGQQQLLEQQGGTR